MELAIIVPSHKRAGRVTTHKYVAGARICIPESQRDDYVRHHPADQLVTHPDSIKGISFKRQWIYETFGNVFMLDDDVVGMHRIWRPAGRKGISSLVTPEDARTIIQKTADVCHELGAFMFGFNSHASPMTYNGFKPFRFGGYTPGGAFGLLKGSKIWFPNSLIPMEDWWACLLNAYHHRYCWYDCRFAFGFKDTYIGQGGCSEIRADDGEKKAFEYLKTHFGKAVQPKKANLAKNRQTTKVERNKYARTMVIPWAH